MQTIWRKQYMNRVLQHVIDAEAVIPVVDATGKVQPSNPLLAQTRHLRVSCRLSPAFRGHARLAAPGIRRLRAKQGNHVSSSSLLKLCNFGPISHLCRDMNEIAQLKFLR